MLKFFISETFKSFGRAKLASLISITTTFIAIIFIVASAAILLLSYKLDEKVKSTISVNVFLQELNHKEINDLKSQIEAEPLIRSVNIIDKAEAKRKFIQETGEDFSSLLDINPLPVSLNVKFYNSKLNEDNLQTLVQRFKTYTGVEEVVYENSSVLKILNYINSSKKLVYVAGFILVILSLYLIYSTSLLITQLKKSQYETMKLVGTKIITMKVPIVLNGIVIGIISSIIAIGTIYFAEKMIYRLIPQLSIDQYRYGMYIAIVAIGITLGFIGASISGRKINLKINRF